MRVCSARLMKCRWKILVFVLAAIVIALCLLLVIPAALSRGAVARYKNQLRAAGEKLDWKELVSPPADPDRNGASLFQKGIDSTGSDLGIISSNPPPAMRMAAPGKAIIGWQQPQIRDRNVTNS